MYNIIMLNDKKQEISKNICCLFSDTYGVSLLTSNSFSDYSSSNAEYLIIALSDLTDFQTENALVVYLYDYDKPHNNNLFSKNNTALYFNFSTSKSYKKEYAVSLNENSDFVISSVSASEIYLSVNKPVLSLNNKSILPCEYKISFSHTAIRDTVSVIIAAIILILTDKTNERLEITF